jgi:2-keto-3-deoxy-L-rhamnonate aldolase RhmA
VPNGEYAIATRALDNGALGSVVPHVDSADEAREVVNRLKKAAGRSPLDGRHWTALWAALCQLQRGRDRPQCRQFD